MSLVARVREMVMKKQRSLTEKAIGLCLVFFEVKDLFFLVGVDFCLLRILGSCVIKVE